MNRKVADVLYRLHSHAARIAEAAGVKDPGTWPWDPRSADGYRLWLQLAARAEQYGDAGEIWAEMQLTEWLDRSSGTAVLTAAKIVAAFRTAALRWPRPTVAQVAEVLEMSESTLKRHRSRLAMGWPPPGADWPDLDPAEPREGPTQI